MTGYDEAVAWFRADPERVRDLDDVDNRSAAITIVNAVLAGAVPAGVRPMSDELTYPADAMRQANAELDRLRARVAELEAAGDALADAVDQHLTGAGEWGPLVDERRAWRTVSTTARTTDWKADEV